jgi:cyclophilin family peptidyl-prolyl cis-trans isomerase
MKAIKLLRHHRLIVPALSSTVHHRTLASGTRGARGHGWLKKYRAGLGGRHLQGRWHYRDVDELNAINNEVFNMNTSLPATGDVNSSKTEAYLDLSVAGESPRRIVIELATAALPKTTENFRLLCQEKGDDGNSDENKERVVGGAKGYKSTLVYKIEKTVGLCLGDVVSNDGTGGRCHPKMGTYTSPYSFNDEGFLISHTGPGIVSMMSPGVHRNDSRFLITTTAAPQLDGRFVAFGRVKGDGMDVINDIVSGVFTKRGRPTVLISIADCGVI